MTGRPGNNAGEGCDERHRQYVTSLICRGKEKILEEDRGGVGRDWRLCVLGAGPGNDLDLSRLAARFDRIALVDLDEQALVAGVANQGFAGMAKFVIHGGEDVTGIHHLLRQLPAGSGQAPQDLRELIRRAESVTWSFLPEKVDVIASTCLLSQLVMALAETVGEQHPQLVAIVKAVRHRHIQLMIDQLAPGGIGVLIVDFVSSDTLPGLAELAEEPLRAATRTAIEQQNFFHGMNPNVIAHLLRTEFSGQLAWHKPTSPWVWRTSARHYAVVAFAFRKRGAGILS
jgi:hypothetical protein